jgi:hypothetical protein
MNEIPDSNLMLKDLMATDEMPDVVPSSPFQSIDQNNLQPTDWSVLLACLMARLGVMEISLTEDEREKLCASPTPGLVRVLGMEMDPGTFELRISLKDTKPSEFRS